MDIKKVSGIGPLAPKPNGHNLKTGSAANFDDALNQALKSGKIDKSGETADTIDPERLKIIRNRIRNLFYDRPDILDSTADKLLNKD